MVLKAETLFFGIDVDATGVRDAANKVAAFAGSVDKAYKQIDQGTKAVRKSLNESLGRGFDNNLAKVDKTARNFTNTLGRQEKAAETYVRRVSAMIANLQKFEHENAGASAQIKQLTAALDQYIARTTRLVLPQQKLAREQNMLNSALQTAGQRLSQFKADKAGKEAESFAAQLRNLQSASVLAVGPLSGLGARISALGAIAGRSQLGIAAIIGAITGAAVGFGLLANSVAKTTIELEKSTSVLRAATGSWQAAGQALDFVISVADDLNSSIAGSVPEFAKLAAAAKGTTLEGSGVEKVFRAVATASTALGLSAEQTGGAIRALQQIISKGKVQAEELRGQLGERIPGAFQIAARAIGMTTAELDKALEQGKIYSEDFLPKFAAALQSTYGDAAEESAGRLATAFNKLDNSLLKFNKSVSDSLDVSEDLNVVVRGAAAVVDFFTGIVQALDGVLGSIITIIGGAFIIKIFQLSKGFLVSAASALGLLKLLPRLDYLLIGLSGSAARVATAFGKFVTLFVAAQAIQAVTSAIVNADESMKKVSGQAKNLTTRFSELMAQAEISDEAFKKFRDDTRNVQAALKTVASAAATTAARYKALGATGGAMIEVYRKYTDVMFRFVDSFGLADEKFSKLQTRMKFVKSEEEALEIYDEMTSLVKLLGYQLDQVSAKKFSTELKSTNKVFDKTKDDVQDLVDGLELASMAMNNFSTADIDRKKSLQEAAKALKDIDSTESARGFIEGFKNQLARADISQELSTLIQRDLEKAMKASSTISPIDAKALGMDPAQAEALNLSRTIDILKTAWAEYQRVIKNTGDATKDRTEEQIKLDRTIRDMNTSLDRLIEDASQPFMPGLEDAVSTSRQAEDSIKDMTDAIRDLQREGKATGIDLEAFLRKFITATNAGVIKKRWDFLEKIKIENKEIGQQISAARTGEEGILNLTRKRLGIEKELRGFEESLNAKYAKMENGEDTVADKLKERRGLLYGLYQAELDLAKIERDRAKSRISQQAAIGIDITGFKQKNLADVLEIEDAVLQFKALEIAAGTTGKALTDALAAYRAEYAQYVKDRRDTEIAAAQYKEAETLRLMTLETRALNSERGNERGHLMQALKIEQERVKFTEFWKKLLGDGLEAIKEINAKWDKHLEGLKALQDAQSKDKAADLTREYERMGKTINAMKTDITGEKLRKLNLEFEKEDAVRKYKEQLESLSDEVRATMMTVEQFEKRFEDLQKTEYHFEKMKEFVEDWANALEQQFDRVRDSLLDALFDGKPIDAMEMLKQGLKDLLKLMLDFAVFNPLKNATVPGQGGRPSIWGQNGSEGMGGDFLGGLFSSFSSGLGSIFGGFLAEGGATQYGKAYMVGEDGPEMFYPGRTGRVEPMGGMNVGGVTINISGVENSDDVQRGARQATFDLIDMLATAQQDMR